MNRFLAAAAAVVFLAAANPASAEFFDLFQGSTPGDGVYSLTNDNQTGANVYGAVGGVGGALVTFTGSDELSLEAIPGTEAAIVDPPENLLIEFASDYSTVGWRFEDGKTPSFDAYALVSVNGGSLLGLDLFSVHSFPAQAYFITGKNGEAIHSLAFTFVGSVGMLDQFRLTAADDSGPVDGVPEPAAWAMMVGGLGLAGAALRRARETARA